MTRALAPAHRQPNGRASAQVSSPSKRGPGCRTMPLPSSLWRRILWRGSFSSQTAAHPALGQAFHAAITTGLAIPLDAAVRTPYAHGFTASLLLPTGAAPRRGLLSAAGSNSRRPCHPLLIAALGGRGRPPAARAMDTEHGDGEEAADPAVDDPGEGRLGDCGGDGGGIPLQRSGRGPFYAVAVGRRTGVFRSWADAEPAVQGFSGAVYKKFSTEGGARAFLRTRGAAAAAMAPASVGAAKDGGGGPSDAGGSVGGGLSSGLQPLPVIPSPSGHEGPFYAVARGHKVGVFTAWAETQLVVRRAPGALYKRFSTRGEAEAFVAQHRLPPPREPGSAAGSGAGTGASPSPSPRPRGRPRKTAPATATAAAAAGADIKAAMTDAASAAAGTAGRLATGGDAGSGDDTERPGAAAVARTAAEGVGEGQVEEEVEEGRPEAGRTGEEQPPQSPSSTAGGGPAGDAAPPYGLAGRAHAPVYYAVARGRQMGIFISWPEARASVEGVRGAQYKKFKQLADAYTYLAAWARAELQPVPPFPPAAVAPAGDSPSVGAGVDGCSGGAAAAPDTWAEAGGGQQQQQPVPGSSQSDSGGGKVPAAQRRNQAEEQSSEAGGARGHHQWQPRQLPEPMIATAGVGDQDGPAGSQPLLRFESLSGVVDPSRRYRLEFDGGSRRNPGDAGFGAVLVDESSGAHVEYVAGPLRAASNNMAEWSALAAGLQVAVDMGVRHLVVQGDSELVCRQVSGRYGVNTPGLQPLAARVSGLRGALASFSVRHVPRAANAVADLLSNLAMDAEEAVAGVAVAGTGGDEATTSSSSSSSVPEDREIVQRMLKELGEPALQAARAAVAAAAAAALSDSVLSTTSTAPAAEGGSAAATGAAIRGSVGSLKRARPRRELASGGARRSAVVVTECRPPLAARGSAAGSLAEFHRVLIALACAGHDFLENAEAEG